MNAAQLAQLKILVTEGWPGELTDTQFDVWAEYLARHPFDTVAAAVRRAIATERFRPPVTVILEAVNDGPTALEVADRAWAAIGRYGWPSEDRARAELPAVVWDAIETFGGWQALCRAADDPATKDRLARASTTAVRRATLTGTASAALARGLGATLALPTVGNRVDG